MSDKFQGKYRNESARLQNWDYGSNAAYFITICTKNREHYLGKIHDGKMMVSPAGSIAHVLWYEIKNHANNIELGEFVVMPNHVHGILVLNGNDVGTTHALSLQSNNDSSTIRTENDLSPPGKQRFQNQGKNTISSIVGSYKSAVSKYCNRLELDFAWQSLFYDHIIRNDESFQKISEYIKNNPANWP
ncbi:MAG: transposase, partial [Bacteroidales bacterium]